jgi:anti-sigma-K factor RskA
MNIRDNLILRQKLAAEYVLGTLKGGARRRFEGWLHQDADLRNITTAWQQRLAPMAEFAGDVAPPKRVWTGIERRLNLKGKAQGWRFWMNENLAFWRNLGMVSTAAAALLLVVVITRTTDVPTIAYVATLTDEKSQSSMVVTADTRHHALDVRVITAAPIADDKSLELWAVPKSGNPRSLGLIAANGSKLALTDKAMGDDVALLAVTLEPRGGSPNPNGPTGPIVYKGAWVRLL